MQKINMSSKKQKNHKQVSQTELRKMMQQMKSKRIVPESNKVLRVNKRQIDMSHPKHESKKPKVSNAQLKKDLDKIIASKEVPKEFEGTVTNLKANIEKIRSNSLQVKNGKNNVEPKLIKVSVSKTNPSSNGGLVSGFYSDSSDDEKSEVEPIHFLPPGDSSKTVGEGSSSVQISKDIITENEELPEGFFDDPEVDAKMRGVETPADKMDREWESFQKELQHAEDQSEQLIEEEQETGHLDREIEEIDEQIKLYNLVHKLADKRDTNVKTVPTIQKSEEESPSSTDEEDNSLLDWREKDAFT